MKKHVFTIGQQLLLKPKYRMKTEHRMPTVTMEKVGIKWLTVRQSGLLGRPIRVDRTFLAVADEYPGGECYIDEADYANRAAMRTAWNELRGDIGYHMPAAITMADIKAARKALGL